MTTITAVFLSDEEGRQGARIAVSGSHLGTDLTGEYDRVHWDDGIEVRQDGGLREFRFPASTPVAVDPTPTRRVLRIGRKAKP